MCPRIIKRKINITHMHSCLIIFMVAVVHGIACDRNLCNGPRWEIYIYIYIYIYIPKNACKRRVTILAYGKRALNTIIGIIYLAFEIIFGIYTRCQQIDFY